MRNKEVQTFVLGSVAKKRPRSQEILDSEWLLAIRLLLLQPVLPQVHFTTHPCLLCHTFHETFTHHRTFPPLVNINSKTDGAMIGHTPFPGSMLLAEL